jgi:SRSO17 transposase
LLAQFLSLFADCFARPAGRSLMTYYVRRLLSDVQRKSVEAIALDQNVRPRTLQRLLESIAWDEAAVRGRCQQIIAAEHSHSEAIGTIDETGTAKSGKHTCGVKRRYNGNRGKIENCVNNVALAYTTPTISCIIDAQLYLPQEWAEDEALRKKRKSLMRSHSRPSPRSHWNWSIGPKPMASK